MQGFCKPKHVSKRQSGEYNTEPLPQCRGAKMQLSSTPESLPGALQHAREVIEVYSIQAKSTTLLCANYNGLVLAGQVRVGVHADFYSWQGCLCYFRVPLRCFPHQRHILLSPLEALFIVMGVRCLIPFSAGPSPSRGGCN